MDILYYQGMLGRTAFQGCLDSRGFYSSKWIHEHRRWWFIQSEECSAGGGLCVDSGFLLAPLSAVVVGVVYLAGLAPSVHCALYSYSYSSYLVISG